MPLIFNSPRVINLFTYESILMVQTKVFTKCFGQSSKLLTKQENATQLKEGEQSSKTKMLRSNEIKSQI